MSRQGHTASVLAASITLGALLACSGTDTIVNGERVLNEGGCPPGEVCVAEVPAGLLFQGQMLYDDGGVPRLGPVLVGGQFDLSFFPVVGVMNGFHVETEGNSLDAGDTFDGPPPGVVLWGAEAGVSSVRVVNSQGALYDTLPFEVVELEDVELTNVSDPSRTELIAGCEEMLGVHLLAQGGSLRAFDQSVSVTAPGGVEPDPGVWDCFRYQVPLDATAVDFEITAANETFVRTVEVREPAPGEPCPTQASSD